MVKLRKRAASVFARSETPPAPAPSSRPHRRSTKSSPKWPLPAKRNAALAQTTAAATPPWKTARRRGISECGDATGCESASQGAAEMRQGACGRCRYACMAFARRFEDLEIWRQAQDLAVRVYRCFGAKSAAVE